MRALARHFSRICVLALLALASPAWADNDIIHFSRGSLIIPVEATYQTACGAISAYGLVWRILQSNQPGHYNAAHPVTVYWGINGTKQSPNRCVPNNLVAPPSPNSAGPSGDTNNWDDPKWNDGCDSVVTNNTEQPVVPVVYSTTFPALPAVYAYGAVKMYTTSSAYARPAFTAVTTLDNHTTAPRFKTIQYMGGPFLIDAVDAENVIKFLKNGDSYVTVGSGQTGALSRFTDTGCTCGGTDPSAGCHYVQMHQSTIDFTATVAKRMNQLPPKIALLNSGGGVSSGILDDYLDNAGLLVTGTGSLHADSGGCPVGTFSGCNLNGSTAATQYPGTIYDQFDANSDLVSTAANPYGLLNKTDAAGKLIYRVFWTPHWEASTSNYAQYVPNGDGAADQRENALKNIARFSNKKGTGLMAECASLESYEGSFDASGSTPACVSAGVCKGSNGPACNTNTDCSSGSGTCTDKVCTTSNNGRLGFGCSQNSDCRTGLSGGTCGSSGSVKICQGGVNMGKTCFSSNPDCINAATYKCSGGTNINLACPAAGASSPSCPNGDGTYSACVANPATYSTCVSSPKICDSGDNNGLACSTNADCPGLIGNPNLAMYTPDTHFQLSNGLIINGLSNQSWDGRNCTDPDYLAISGTRPACTYYPNPGDPFSQLGDFRYVGTGGHVHNYRPYRSNTPASAYKIGVKRLAAAWTNYQSGQYPDTQPDGDDGWDFFTLALKDNDPNKATVIYLAGHSYTGTVPGNRIVLNTLLNLGADPIGSDRALAAPVAYNDPNGSDGAGTRAMVVAPTYEAVTGYPPGADTFVITQSSRWVFPYTPGHLRAHSLIGGDALVTGANAHDQHTLWDANDKMPAPRDRNLFTYFGGDVATNPNLGNASYKAPHNALQVGWVPENVAGGILNGNFLNIPNGACVDVLQYGSFHNKKKNTDDFGLIPGPDGICDLQQAIEYSSLNPGNDFGGSEHAANIAVLIADLPANQTLLQRVRGYCAANVGKVDGLGAPILEPALTDCNDPNATNVARLGGLVHSSPAIVPPSSNVGDSGAARPTVAYVGGFDGQLHAIYVSGGSGYTGPSDSLNFVNPDASSKFVTNWASRFASSNPPAAGTELWSFLPPSQLPLLKGNNARVDSTPVVQDVFIDPKGTGVREWHTILVASIGGTGRELFALDVTNPLKPALMWDLVGSLAQTGGYPLYSPALLANDPVVGTAYSFKWGEATADFKFPPATDPGRSATGIYDFSDLGGASGLSIAQLRAGLEPVYAVFAATSVSGVDPTLSKGLEVFAIDVASGQKLWQWEQPYTSSAPSDNTVPPVASVVESQDGASALLVGDMEGRVWELGAASGANLNAFTGIPGCAGTCKFPLLDTGSSLASAQPITTNISLAKVPPNPSAGSALASYGQARLAVVGTAGADWAGASPGNLHVLLYDSNYRVPLRTGGTHLDGTSWTQPAALAWAQGHGVLQEPAAFPVTMAAGEHLYGAITTAGQSVFFETARGGVNDLMTLSATTAGQTLKIDLSSASAASPATALAGFGLANYGGVTVFHNPTGSTSTDYVIGSEVSKLTMMSISNAGATGAVSPNSQLDPRGPRSGYRFMGWLQRLLK